MPTPTSRATLTQLGEFGLIERMKRRTGRSRTPVLRGIGDDAAVIRLNHRQLLLLSTDVLIEGIHFDPSTSSMEDIGYKAVVSNLSDIAAMGGTPQYIMVALAVPPSQTSASIDRLYDGLVRACRHYKVQLVGGDTSASPRSLFLCVSITGLCRDRRFLARGGARIGDLLYVTGTLGDSLCGLRILQQRARSQSASRSNASSKRHLGFLVNRHLHPVARVGEGLLLASQRLATAALDLSDGLSGDIHHLCQESRVGAEVEAEKLPISPGCRWYATLDRTDPTHFALLGGEDYELLFTVPPDKQEKVTRLGQKHGFRFTCIGRIRPRRFGIRVKALNGSSWHLAPASYQHFRQTPPLKGNIR